MADQKISALTSIAGANIVTSTDIIPLVDTSAAQTKQITFDEFAIALNVSTATQAQMETASTSTTTVRPSMAHFHPGSAKAWGAIAVPTTVSASFPATGVSVVANAGGNYTVTLGRTFSSANYSVQVCVVDTTGNPFPALVYQQGVSTFSVKMYKLTDGGGGFLVATLTAPDSGFNYACYGDL